MTEINTLLVANRGEITRRVFRTCRDLGIRTVAVHTDLDAGALHVREADVAIAVPSYLDVDAVLAAAKQAGADAIHPGYGFLSENAGFARAVNEAGIVWVGPSPEVIDKMGRKDAARDIAVAAGVPVVPSYSLDDDPDTLNYPVLVKAAAGGGGKGMRVVVSAAELPEGIAAAKREAASAFGDDTMLIEKYVERGRHIEVQVLGDRHGQVVHLGTRECSAQRRHQKVIEEAPAPALSDEVRERMHACAVALSASVGYENAGTIEFLLDAEAAGSGDFYFLEMNTRLQVEHPVTEIHSATDLVALQLAVAAGDPLPFDQSGVQFGEHAFEARVYAEDAFGGFLPQAGTATVVAWPQHARVDHALVSGQVVSTSYDPMLGKVITAGPDRETARRGLVAALDDTVILGLTTNTGFLRALAASEEFTEPGGVDTAWLDRNEVTPPDPGPARELAARLWLSANTAPTGPFVGDGFRMGGPALSAVVEFTDGTVCVRSNDLSNLSTAQSARASGRRTAQVTPHGVELAHQGQRYVFTRPDARSEHGAALGDGEILAPMPGTVLEVRVSGSQQVSAGEVLGVVEAMKMELALKAPYPGTVEAINTGVGQQVALGAVLFVVAPLEEDQ
ncbi:MAG: ATP-grasp domain-containing protein [Nocardioidaceae bacterium]|nr:ATP-grasp domain-containing protein [Nocardioidaceae bacterium]